MKQSMVVYYIRVGDSRPLRHVDISTLHFESRSRIDGLDELNITKAETWLQKYTTAVTRMASRCLYLEQAWEVS